MTKNLWFILPNLDMNGPAYQCSLLARRLLGSEFHPVILCLNHEGELAKSTSDAGVPVMCAGLDESDSFRACYRIRNMLKSEKVDIVHTFLAEGEFGAVRGAASAKVPSVVVSRRAIVETLSHKELKLRRKSTASANLVVCNSKAAQANACQMEDISEEMTCVIHNGFPAENVPEQTAILNPPPVRRYLQSCQIQDKERVLLCVADFHENKNHRRLMDALRILLLRPFFIRLIMIGDGPIKDEVERYVGDLGIYRAVDFLGKRSERLKIMAECHGLVMPAMNEGFSNVVMEAQAIGIPVAASRAGGVVEQIEHGKTGLLFDPSNAEEMAKVIHAILFRREEAAKLAVNAQPIVRSRFNAETMVENYLKAYRQLG